MWKRVRSCLRCGRKGYQRRKSESSAEKTQSEADDKSNSQLGSLVEESDNNKKLNVNSPALAEEEDTSVPEESTAKNAADDVGAVVPVESSQDEARQDDNDQNNTEANFTPEQLQERQGIPISRECDVLNDVEGVVIVRNQDTPQLEEAKEVKVLVSTEGRTIQNINNESLSEQSGDPSDSPKAVETARCEEEIQEEKITKLSSNAMESAVEDILGALDDLLDQQKSTSCEVRTVEIGDLSATKGLPTAAPIEKVQSTTSSARQERPLSPNTIPEIIVTEEGIEAKQQPEVESNLVLRGQAVPSPSTNITGVSQDDMAINDNDTSSSSTTEQPVILVETSTHTPHTSEKKSKRRSLILVEKFSEQLSNSVMDAVLHEPESESGPTMRSSRDDLSKFSSILADSIVRTVLDYSRSNRNQSMDSEDNSNFGVSIDDSEADESIQGVNLEEFMEDDSSCIDESEEGAAPLTSLDVYAKKLSEQIVRNVLKEEFDNNNAHIDDGSSTVELYISNLTEAVISNAIESVLGSTDKRASSEMDIGSDSSMDVLVSELVQNVLQSALSRMTEEIDEGAGNQEEYENSHIGSVGNGPAGNGMVTENGKLQSKWLSEDDLDELYEDDLSDDSVDSESIENGDGQEMQGRENGSGLTNGEKANATEPETSSFLRPHSARKEETSVWRRSLIEDLEEDLDFDEEDSPCGSPTKSEGNFDSFLSPDGSEDEAVTPTAKVPPGPSQVSHVASSRSRLRSVDSTPTLVFDNGSGFLKVGYSTDSMPKEVIPSVVGLPLRYSQDISGMEYSSRPGLVFGDMAVSKAGVLHNDYPLKADVIEKWSDIEGLWNYVLSSLMSIPEHPEFPVLITQPALNSKKHTEKLAEIMFEKFHMPSLFIANQPALALYSMGYTSGVSFCSGFNNTQAGVVYEGHVMPHTVRQLDIAGYQLTETLKKLLMSGQGFGFRSSSQWKIVNDIKRKMAFVSTDFQGDVKRYKTEADLHKPYELPDGQVIEVGSERFGCAEILFRPQELGLTQLPAHMLIADAIQSCDEDLQETCYKAIGISGGTTLMKGFPQRLEQELRQHDRKCKNLIVPEHRDLSTWLGGAIMGALPTFGEMVVNVDEYADVGARIVHTKCF